MAINQVARSNTFSDWRIVTNNLVTAMNKLTEGGNTFQTNTSMVLSGPGTVLVVNNAATFGTVNANSIQSTSILTTVITANGISLLTHANNAYAQANIANTRAVGAFAQANSAWSTANTADSRATGAFAQANGSWSNSNTADSRATGAFAQANGAWTSANTADSRAVGAFAQANSAWSTANTADSRATGAFAQANSAWSTANTASINASDALSLATAVSVDNTSSSGINIYQGKVGNTFYMRTLKVNTITDVSGPILSIAESGGEITITLVLSPSVGVGGVSK